MAYIKYGFLAAVLLIVTILVVSTPAKQSIQEWRPAVVPEKPAMVPEKPVNGSTIGLLSISGVDGPTQLAIGQQGTWSVRVNNPSGQLSYSVLRWDDEAAPPLASTPITSSDTFTHTYTSAGTYAPMFMVTNGNGKSIKGIAVVVGYGTTNQTFSATPTSGQAPLTVTFTYWQPTSHVSAPSPDFGDGSSGQMTNVTTTSCNPSRNRGLNCPQTWRSVHTYTFPGTYTAELIRTCGNTESCATSTWVVGTTTITVY